jgi:hypothetical protein
LDEIKSNYLRIIKFGGINSLKIKIACLNGVKILHSYEQQQLPEIINVWA